MIGILKFLALTLCLQARITLALISSSAIILCFQNVNFQGLYKNFGLPSVFLYALVSLLWSVNSLFYIKSIAF